MKENRSSANINRLKGENIFSFFFKRKDLSVDPASFPPNISSKRLQTSSNSRKHKLLYNLTPFLLQPPRTFYKISRIVWNSPTYSYRRTSPSYFPTVLYFGSEFGIPAAICVVTSNNLDITSGYFIFSRHETQSCTLVCWGILELSLISRVTWSSQQFFILTKAYLYLIRDFRCPLFFKVKGQYGYSYWRRHSERIMVGVLFEWIVEFSRPALNRLSFVSLYRWCKFYFVLR